MCSCHLKGPRHLTVVWRVLRMLRLTARHPFETPDPMTPQTAVRLPKPGEGEKFREGLSPSQMHIHWPPNGTGTASWSGPAPGPKYRAPSQPSCLPACRCCAVSAAIAAAAATTSSSSSILASLAPAVWTACTIPNGGGGREGSQSAPKEGSRSPRKGGEAEGPGRGRGRPAWLGEPRRPPCARSRGGGPLAQRARGGALRLGDEEDPPAGP